MKKLHIDYAQKGLTLVELLIAMLLGVLLTAGVINIFIGAKSNYKLQENLSRLQENGQLALNLISNDIRMAGYIAPAAVLSGTNNATNTNTCFARPQAFDLANAGANAADWCYKNNQNCVTSTDTANCTANTICNTTNSIRLDVIRSYQWNTATSCGLVFPTGGSATVNGVVPAAGAKEVSYFLRTDDSNATALGTVPSLWRYDTSQGTPTQERVQNIEQMVVLYGVDTDATPDDIPNYYVTADKVGTTTNWANIVSIRISILAVSDSIGLTDRPVPYTFNGQNISLQSYTVNGKSTSLTLPPVCELNGIVVSNATTCTAPSIQVEDTRLRRAFTTTIAIRNRLY